MKYLYMKCLVLSLSLFLCFQSAQALDAQLFNSYIADIRNNKLDAVGSYLEQNKTSAETDPDYTVIYLNYQFFKGRVVQTIVARGDSQPGDLELTKQDDPSIKGFIREKVTFDKPSILEAIQVALNNLKSFSNQLYTRFRFSLSLNKIYMV